MEQRYSGEIDPFACPHYKGRHVGDHLLCEKDGSEVWVMCRTSHFGELPRCSRLEPDNSERARAERKAYINRPDA